MDKPEGVTPQDDGFFYKDGRRYCEDCWAPIPQYVDFPQGLTSPESDGDKGGNFAKRRKIDYHDKKDVWEPLRKAVCLDCYNLAFARVYPGAELPELSRMVRVTTEHAQPEPIATSSIAYIPDPLAL